MQIVIEINEKDYKEIMEKDAVTKLEMKIRNGTPLPKGHGRLIDADVLRNDLKQWEGNDYCPSDFIDELDDAPTIIEADKE